MLNGVFNGHPFVGIELQRSKQKVFCLWRNGFEYLFEGLSFTVPEGFNVLSGSLVADEIDFERGANDAEDDRSKCDKTYSWSWTE
jgi:hypothetical protein